MQIASFFCHPDLKILYSVNIAHLCGVVLRETPHKEKNGWIRVRQISFPQDHKKEKPSDSHITFLDERRENVKHILMQIDIKFREPDQSI